MAPLIRYAGLGEKPPAGLFRAPFGPSQARFLAAGLATGATQIVIGLAPVAIAFALIVATIREAATKIYASFPDSESLHTVDYVAGADALSLRGTLWFYDYGLFAAAGAALFLITFAMLVVHHGRSSDGSARTLAGRFGAAGATMGFFAALIAAAGAMYGLLVTLNLSGPLQVMAAVVESPSTRAVAFFAFSAFVFVAYIALRVGAYPAIAVCRGSMAPGGLFALTRGGNIVRLFLSSLLLALVLVFMQVMLAMFGFGVVIAAGDAIGQLVASLVRLTFGNEAGAGMERLFIGVAAVAQIGFTLLWTMFANGVIAGYFGRLYRDSEAARAA
jgi:hypothetical protein